jgi:hypothetical protein
LLILNDSQTSQLTHEEEEGPGRGRTQARSRPRRGLRDWRGACGSVGVFLRCDAASIALRLLNVKYIEHPTCSRLCYYRCRYW